MPEHARDGGCAGRRRRRGCANLAGGRFSTPCGRFERSGVDCAHPVPGDVPEPGGDLSANSATKTWGPTVAAALGAEYRLRGIST